VWPAIGFCRDTDTKEYAMRNITRFATLAAVSTLMFGALGCADNGTKPYSLTGDSSFTPEQQQYINQHSIDQKGHWNPQLNEQAKSAIRHANQNGQ
jgi:hypothetical protein